MTIKEVEDYRKRWLRIRSANLYDTLDKMGYSNQCIDLQVKPIVGKRIAGPAMTIASRKAPFSKEEIDSGNTDMIPFEKVMTLVEKGDVLIVEGAGEKFSGKFGEMTSWGIKQHGASGIVIDGFIRDYEGLLEIPDFTVCSKGTSSIESNRRWIMTQVNVPIGFPGTLTSLVRISKGDWIVGDADSVIIVPKEIMPEVLEKAEDIEQREELMRKDLAKGVSFQDCFEKYGRA